MKRKQTDRAFLIVSICGFALMSISFLLMPLENMSILPGSLFWGGLILGVAFQIALEARRRVFFARYNVNRKKMQRPRNGLLSFGSNKIAKTADITLAVSVVATILAFLLTRGTGYICYICIAVSLLSFCLHCILNGRNYFHANNQDRVRQVLENKEEITSKKGEGKK